MSRIRNNVIMISLGWTYQIWSHRVQTDTSFSGVGSTIVTFESGDWNPRLIDAGRQGRMMGAIYPTRRM